MKADHSYHLSCPEMLYTESGNYKDIIFLFGVVSHCVWNISLEKAARKLKIELR